MHWPRSDCDPRGRWRAQPRRRSYQVVRTSNRGRQSWSRKVHPNTVGSKRDATELIHEVESALSRDEAAALTLEEQMGFFYIGDAVTAVSSVIELHDSREEALLALAMAG